MKQSLILAVLLLSSALLFSQDVLTNQSIVELIEIGFESDVIKSKINASQTEFDTSISALKALKEKGVPSDVLALMIDKSKVEIESGVFCFENEQIKKIEPTVFSGTKSSTVGGKWLKGYAPTHFKSYIHNASSANKVNIKEQVFIFQFDLDSQNDLGHENWWFKTASSPNEFVLTSLTQITKKNQRELVTGSSSGYNGSTQMGIDTEKTIPVTIEDLGNGKYKVQPEEPLKSGEYCFFYQGAIPLGGYTNQSLFDFSIQ